MSKQIPTSNPDYYKMPSYITSIIAWCVPFDLQEAIKGDIAEGLFNRLIKGNLLAYIWLCKQIIAILWHFSPATQRGSLMFIFGSILVSGIILMTFWLGGSLQIFFDLPSLIIVMVPALIAPFLTLSKDNVFDAFKILFDSNTSPDNLETHQRVFETMDKTAMLMGWFGVISGSIAIAGNVNVDSFEQVFGPAFAVMALTLLYALIVKVFCYFAVLRINSFKTVAN
jgi:hypothetical protein